MADVPPPYRSHAPRPGGKGCTAAAPSHRPRPAPPHEGATAARGGAGRGGARTGCKLRPPLQSTLLGGFLGKGRRAQPAPRSVPTNSFPGETEVALGQSVGSPRHHDARTVSGGLDARAGLEADRVLGHPSGVLGHRTPVMAPKHQ